MAKILSFKKLKPIHKITIITMYLKNVSLLFWAVHICIVILTRRLISWKIKRIFSPFFQMIVVISNWIRNIHKWEVNRNISLWNTNIRYPNSLSLKMNIFICLKHFSIKNQILFTLQKAFLNFLKKVSFEKNQYIRTRYFLFLFLMNATSLLNAKLSSYFIIFSLPW